MASGRGTIIPSGDDRLSDGCVLRSGAGHEGRFDVASTPVYACALVSESSIPQLQVQVREPLPERFVAQAEVQVQEHSLPQCERQSTRKTEVLVGGGA